MTVGRKRVFRSKEADDDLVSIWLFCADEWSPELADRHLHHIGSLCDWLLDNPELGRKRDDLLPGVRSILVRPHVVYYKVSLAGVQAVRVLHQRIDVQSTF
jgi:toxin ParE1/3/4